MSIHKLATSLAGLASLAFVAAEVRADFETDHVLLATVSSGDLTAYRSIVRYGGTRTYNRLTPIFLGLIAGEVLGGLFPALFGAVYYFVSGNQPRLFNVIPG